MNKDDYAMMKIRQEIVGTFIEKLEKVNIGDTGLIPALIDYIQTGDKDMFEEYNQFRTNTNKDKLKHLERVQAELSRQIYEMGQEIEQSRSRLERARSEYMDYAKQIDDYYIKNGELAMEIDEKYPNTQTTTLGLLQNFISEAIKRKHNNCLSKLYIKIGDKLSAINGFTFIDEGKAILEVGKTLDINITPPKPRRALYKI